LIRASTSLFPALEGVDGRDKPGHDEIRGSIRSVIQPQDFPQTVLRFRGNDDKCRHAILRAVGEPF